MPNHCRRNTGPLGNLDTIASAGWAGPDFVQENDARGRLGGGQMDVGRRGRFRWKPGQLKVVRRKQRERLIVLQ